MRVMDNETADYIVFDWRSWKLPRVSRSSLASEAQAAAGGVDALEFAKCFWSLSLDDRRDPLGEARLLGLHWLCGWRWNETPGTLKS